MTSAGAIAGERAATEPVLALGEVSKTFPGQVALDRVSLDVRPGRVRALVGQNGSGKSTLIKIVAGYHRADPGSHATLLGRDLDLVGTPDTTGIHVMHQDLGLVDSLDAVENLALGRGFQTTTFGRVRWRSEVERAAAELRAIGATFDPRTQVGRLSPSDRALVALARALQGSAEGGALLILDEPTASMTRPDVRRLFDAVHTVRARGAGVLFVSHRLDEVFEIADDVTVLRDGRVVGSGEVADIDHEGLVEMIVGRNITVADAAEHHHGGAPVLRVRDLWGAQLEAFDLTVHAGEIVGVAGVVGSGREELPMLLFGATRRAAGTVELGGSAVPADPRAAVAAGLALVPAERARYGSIAGQTIRENVTLARLRPLVRRGVLSKRLETADVARWVERVELRPPDTERRFATLSGGNQQKAVIARWLRTDPVALVVDEPTQGVDVGAKRTVHDLLRHAAANGLAVVACSSEAEELAALCDRVVVLRHGRAVAELHGAALSADAIVLEMLR